MLPRGIVLAGVFLGSWVSAAPLTRSPAKIDTSPVEAAVPTMPATAASVVAPPVGLPAVVPTEPASPAAVTASASQLATPSSEARFKSLLRVDFGDDPARFRAIDEALNDILSTPTGDEYARRWVESGGRAKISFEKIPYSKLVNLGDRRVLVGSEAYMHVASGRTRVILNEAFLRTDEQYRRAGLSSAIAHELLGHGLGLLQAAQAGLSKSYEVYRGDETRACLLGWLATAELGHPLSDPWMWRYLKSPERFHHELDLSGVSYATTFNRHEMPRALEIMRRRLTRARRDQSATSEARALVLSWGAILERMLSFGVLTEEFVKNVRAHLDLVGAWKRDRAAVLVDIVSLLEEEIQAHVARSGQAESERVIEQSRSPFFDDTERQIGELTTRLGVATRGMRRTTYEAPRRPGLLTWRQFKKIFKADERAHPRRYRSLKP